MIKLEIDKIIVMLRDHGGDLIRIHTKLPCPYSNEFLPSQPPLVLEFETTYDWGVQYCIDNFGIEPEIFNVRID